MSEAGLIRHLRNYASAGALSAIVGIVSFPLLTRNLSVADYGLVGLITATTAFFIAIGKLGVQHAVVRYFSQIREGNAEFDLQQMHSTALVLFSVLAVSATAVWLFSGYFVLPSFLQSENISSLFLVGSGIVFVRVLGSCAMNFLRASQRSVDVAVAQGTARVLNLFLIVALLLSTTLNPWLIVACVLIAETAGMCYAAYQYRSELFFSRHKVSALLARAMLVYGLPLMLLESMILILRLSDRYLIESMLGVTALGQYSASYNICSYLEIIIIAAILQALRPAYMQLWEASGKEKTSQFLAESFYLYMVVGIPFVVMFALTSPYLLSLLAGQKYQPGTVIIPYVALSYWMDGAMLFLAAGLYIFKDTKLLMLCGLGATIINVGLNLVMIPRFGITGAAAVTVFSYGLFMLTVTCLAFRRVRFRLRVIEPLVLTVLSIVVYSTLSTVDFDSALYNFIIKGLLGSCVLMAAIWLLVPELQRWLSQHRLLPGKHRSV
ncbi:MAG: oligosaccharide flippase family protein [Granulosicoccus sp.]|nr:oligosaccharide flippase family protein [Granulosicoccus sp.]